MHKFLNLDKNNFFYLFLLLCWCSLWFMSCGPSLTKLKEQTEFNERRLQETIINENTYFLDSTFTSEQPTFIEYYNGHKYVHFGINYTWGGHAGDCKNPSHKCNCK